MTNQSEAIRGPGALPPAGANEGRMRGAGCDSPWLLPLRGLRLAASRTRASLASGRNARAIPILHLRADAFAQGDLESARFLNLGKGKRM